MNDATPASAARSPRASPPASPITASPSSDDYAWLRDPGYPEVKDAEVLAHLAAENAWFEARMAPHQGTIDALFKEMRARIKEADKSVPQKDGDWLYWIEFEEGAEYKKWWRKPVAGGPDELILDEPALAEGKEYFRLGAISTSKDGRLLAYSVDDNGSERFTARIKDLATGEHLPDEIPGTLSSLVWVAGDTGPDLLARQRAVAHRQRAAALARPAGRGGRRALSRGRRGLPRLGRRSRPTRSG